MASQRQIQDKRESTQEDSLGIADAERVTVDRAESKPKQADKSPKLVNSAPKDDGEAPQKLDSLVAMLQGELSAIDPDAAMKMLDEFYHLVHQSKQPEAKEIATGIKELQKLLKRKEPTAHEIGESMSHLGEQTCQIALLAEKELKTPLQYLGKQLIKVARSLSKAEDLEHLESLDSIVDILEQPNKIDVKSAIVSIDLWHNLLQKSNQDRLKEIATELKDLKHMLKGDKSKSGDLSQKLIQIGDRTTAAAETATRGFKGVIQKLGKVLSAFGKSLA